MKDLWDLKDETRSTTYKRRINYRTEALTETIRSALMAGALSVPGHEPRTELGTNVAHSSSSHSLVELCSTHVQSSVFDMLARWHFFLSAFSCSEICSAHTQSCVFDVASQSSPLQLKNIAFHGLSLFDGRFNL